MSFFETTILQTDNALFSAAGEMRVSQKQIFFNGVTISEDNALLWENNGTGTSSTFSLNKYSLSCTTGQFRIRKSRAIHPYIAGNSQRQQFTFDGFGLQTGGVKRMGCFTSTTTTPFNSSFDGFFLESDGVTTNTIRLKIINNGTTVLDIPQSSFDNASLISSYNWNNFGVVLFDYVWQGGATFRLFLKTSQGYILLHTYTHAGNNTDTMFLSPHLPVRYEARNVSSGTAVTMRVICAEVSSEGHLNTVGTSCSIRNTALIATNTALTTYALLGVRHKTTALSIPIYLQSMGVGISGTVDNGILYILRNPTLLISLTYADSAEGYPFQTAQGGALNTVSNFGRIIGEPLQISNSTGQISTNFEDYGAWIDSQVDGTRAEYVLAYQPLSATQSVVGTLTVKTF